jgi:hypothetical protein
MQKRHIPAARSILLTQNGKHQNMLSTKNVSLQLQPKMCTEDSDAVLTLKFG